VRPEAILCLGAVAASQVFDRNVRLKDLTGRAHDHIIEGALVYVTYHPSALLRAPDEVTRKKIEKSIEQTIRMAWNAIAASLRRSA
jgi:uracil-DNA glycosylase family 4